MLWRGHKKDATLSFYRCSCLAFINEIFKHLIIYIVQYLHSYASTHSHWTVWENYSLKWPFSPIFFSFFFLLLLFICYQGHSLKCPDIMHTHFYTSSRTHRVCYAKEPIVQLKCLLNESERKTFSIHHSHQNDISIGTYHTLYRHSQYRKKAEYESKKADDTILDYIMSMCHQGVVDQ